MVVVARDLFLSMESEELKPKLNELGDGNDNEAAEHSNIALELSEMPLIENQENANLDSTDGGNKQAEDEIVMLDDTDDENSSGKTRRLSLYGMAGKKTAAQGLMDIALITANANQLRYLLEFNRASPTFNITASLIIFSLTLQVAVAMFLIFKGRYYVKGESKSTNAKRVKNCVLFGVFLITVVNVFIASFTTMDVGQAKRDV